MQLENKVLNNKKVIRDVDVRVLAGMVRRTIILLNFILVLFVIISQCKTYKDLWICGKIRSLV